jgi:hypothetical protein
VPGTKINTNPVIKLAVASFLFLRVIKRTMLINRINNPISASREVKPSMSGSVVLSFEVNLFDASMVNRHDGFFRKTGTNNMNLIGKLGRDNPINFLAVHSNFVR